MVTHAFEIRRTWAYILRVGRKANANKLRIDSPDDHSIIIGSSRRFFVTEYSVIYRSRRTVYIYHIPRRLSGDQTGAGTSPSIWLTVNPATRSSRSGKATCSYAIPWNTRSTWRWPPARATRVCRTRIRSGVRRHSHSLRALVLRWCSPSSRETYVCTYTVAPIRHRSFAYLPHRHRLTASAEFSSLIRSSTSRIAASKRSACVTSHNYIVLYRRSAMFQYRFLTRVQLKEFCRKKKVSPVYLFIFKPSN